MSGSTEHCNLTLGGTIGSPSLHEATPTPCLRSAPDIDTVALAVHKRGRWCVIGKITYLDDEPILAVAHRHQRGAIEAISIPTLALEYAELAGCHRLYLRRDAGRQMWRMSLADMREVGWFSPDGEWFVLIADMERVPWKWWSYAKATIKLGANGADYYVD